MLVLIHLNCHKDKYTCKNRWKHTLACPRPSAAGKFLFLSYSLINTHTQGDGVRAHSITEIYPGELLPPRRLFHI